MKVKSESEVAQSCPTLSDPMDCSPPGSSVQGIFQARVLEWGAIAFSTLYMPIISPLQVVKIFKTSLDLPQRVKFSQLRVTRQGGENTLQKRKWK